MLKFWRSPTRPLSLGYYHGDFARDQIMDELQRAYRDGDIVPGTNRLIHVAHVSEPGLVAVSDLADIQKRVQHLESSMRLVWRGFRSPLLRADALGGVGRTTFQGAWCVT